MNGAQLSIAGTSAPPDPAAADATRDAEAEVHFARVAVFVPLSQSYSFQIPRHLSERVVPGARVVCPFGNRKVLGVVLDVAHGDPGVPASRLKPVLDVVDDEPVVPAELLSFSIELASYYLAPIGEVMRLCVPAVERSRASELSGEGLSHLTGVGRQVSYAAKVAESSLTDAARESTRSLKGQASQILEHLATEGACPVADLTKRWGNARSAVKKLAAAGLVECFEKVRIDDDSFSTPVERDVPPTLNPAQAAAVAAIGDEVRKRRAHSFLLHGVTASGKTEVYLRSVQAALETGGGALLLVPEIALTPQLVGRFRARLGDTIAVLHSGLSDRQRYATWKRLRSGELKVAIGARSALFAPVQSLALICVDEEQDTSFKQEEGVRYNARDMALLRAYRAKATCVLGSATPSLKSFHGVSAGKLTRLDLPDRAHATAVLPEAELVDLRRVGPGAAGEKLLSLPLCRALEQVLERGQQAIVFLNRRGFAPSVTCESCGKVLDCPSCEVALTYHRSPRPHVICHYCGFRDQVPQSCRHCQSPRLSYEGIGTERVEAALAQAFPQARIGRLDRDTGAGLKSERVLSKMQSGELDVLVGTQMVTKGHDLPRVTLVGVLNADSALSLPDFQASERTFQLLVQVAGRAGRAGTRGKVLIQTRNPEHPAVSLALRHDVEGFARYALDDRQSLGYPPFSRLAMVRVSAVEDRVAREGIDRLGQVARQHAGSDVEILGPAAAPIARLRNRYRHRLMVRAKSRNRLRRVLWAVLAAPIDRRLRRTVDVDPVSML